MTIGPRNGREPVGRNENAGPDQPEGPSEPARRAYAALRASVKRSDAMLAAVERLARSVDAQVGPLAAELTATTKSARSALAEGERALAQARGTLARLEPTADVTLKDIQTLARNLDERVAKLSVSLDRALTSADDVLASDSPVRRSLVTALDELADAAESIRTLANYLERNPNSLVFGKGRAAK